MADTTDLTTGIYFGEGPRWHGGALWFSDFYSHSIHRLTMDGERSEMVGIEGQPSGLGWLPNGDMLVVSMKDLAVMRVDAAGNVSRHADVSPTAAHLANDMLVDAAGRAYVGNFGFDLDGFLSERGPEAIAEAPTTRLALVQPDGSVSTAATDLSFPNGMVLSADGRTLILAETLALRLTAFDVGPDGTLSNRRVWADLSDRLVAPDGIAIDSEGAVWAANALAPQAVRVLDGTVVEEVETSQTCFAVALGGPDGHTLFACTAPTSTADVASAEPLAKVEIVKVAVRA